MKPAFNMSEYWMSYWKQTSVVEIFQESNKELVPFLNSNCQTWLISHICMLLSMKYIYKKRRVIGSIKKCSCQMNTLWIGVISYWMKTQLCHEVVVELVFSFLHCDAFWLTVYLHTLISALLSCEFKVTLIIKSNKSNEWSRKGVNSRCQSTHNLLVL